ncbi:class I SAM-dependent methyltransferase [Mycobacteroides abscessus]|uniref:class I SAM-dependent methyltransferase n=1 Tax=Mycobacteroides abscessus TaxID=36809 RepID=UPI0021069FAF|nr:class I SAM-dependent methyltransferase [Mycobacteroides abscessus]
MTDLIPNYSDVQQHYDLSNEFFFLFLDQNKVYSCAYFDPPGLSLESAQLAKIDLSLSKLHLSAGQTLLDVGCGWGATIIRAAERYGVRAIGLTLSRKQNEYCRNIIAERNLQDYVEVRLQGWEEFDKPVDRVVSIGAFEHFGSARYSDFYSRMSRIMPADGRMLLHTIGIRSSAELSKSRTRSITREDVHFARFMKSVIFPGGELPRLAEIPGQAAAAGFSLELEQSLQLHYAWTLDHWAENLRSQRLRAIEVTSEETFEIYMRYLVGCADAFRARFIDVAQFTLTMS